jgi:uncharacterized Zn finger protein
MTAVVASRESAQTKGRRYLIEGRLRLLLVHGARIYAEVRGNGETYHCGHVKGRWWCECPARGTCAHLVSLQLVVDRPDRSAP